MPNRGTRYGFGFFPSFHKESNRGPLDYEHDVLSTMLCAHRQKFEPAHMLKSLTHAVAIDIVNLEGKLSLTTATA